MSQVIQLSEHFTLAEATASDTALRLGIDNTNPPQEVLQAAYRAATRMEKVRELLHTSIHINSWIRCLSLNTAVGSKPSSQHVKGEAVDFTATEYGSCLEVVKVLITNQSLLRYDQLILEHTWIHISFCPPVAVPRGEVLSLLTTGHYSKGLTDKEGKPYG
jgi:hypothetical protein